MMTGMANGHTHNWVGWVPGERGQRGEAQKNVKTAAEPASAWPHAGAGVAELRRALEASQQQIAAALRQIDALVKRDELVKQEVVQLTKAVAQARRCAYQDQLTSLPNRGLLLDRFNQAVAHAARQHKHVALLFVDLDHFKSINDEHGHVTGDRLLQQVATRLITRIRASDTACRYGGDEFIVLLPELDSRQAAMVASEKIRAYLAAPYVIDGTTLRLTASIGVAVYPFDGEDFGCLMRHSDRAMFCDKRGRAARLACPRLLYRAPLPAA